MAETHDDAPANGDKYWAEASNWDRTSSHYNSAVGMSSKQATPHLVAMAHALSPLDAADARAIDLAAGTGALTHTLASSFPGLPILATDISPQMLEQLGEGLSSGEGEVKVTTRVLDMLDPVGQGAEPASFSHVFSTMALQGITDPDDPERGAMVKWMELLRPGGVMALGTWDFDERCGPHEVWEASVKVVDPTYQPPPLVEKGIWLGHRALESGVKNVGLEDIKVDVVRVGFDVGVDGFMHFWWKSGNPWVLLKQGSFKGDMAKVKEVMPTVLKEKFENGWSIPLYAALAVGRKPADTVR